MSVNIDHGSSFEGDRDLWVNLGGAGRKDWELELWHDFSLPVSRLRPCLATPFSRPRWVRSFSSAPPKTPLDFRMSEITHLPNPPHSPGAGKYSAGTLLFRINSLKAGTSVDMICFHAAICWSSWSRSIRATSYCCW